MTTRTGPAAPGRNGRATAPAVPPAPEPAYAAPPRLGVAPPPAPRRRGAVAGVLVGALFAAACMFGFATVLASTDKRASVLVAARPVPAGQRFTATDLKEAKVAADPGVGSLTAAQRPQVVGKVAAFGVPAGALLTDGHVSSGPAVEAGAALVGLALRAGQYPPGLRPTDRVRLVTTAGQGQAGQPGQAATLVAEARVFAVGTDGGQGARISVVVADADATKVTAAAAAGTVAVALLGGAG